MTKKDGQTSKLSVEPYKGVRDFYPEDQAFLHYFIDTIRGVVERVGYVEYHASILEPSELYKSKNAENVEIVNEQTYTFVDRGGREVTLRPEMTPTVARMVAARRRELGFPLRLYSIPNVFRYERPQRGRLREHWQLNVDVFGSKSMYADAEVIGVAYGIMRAFGAEESDFVIKIGSRTFLDKIIADTGLGNDQSKKFMGLLDRRGKISADEFVDELRALGVPLHALEASAPEDVQKMIGEFAAAGIGNLVWDPSIVRGFAYYTGIVFEVFDTHPDNNRALFGGGRYDNLTAMFDDENIAAVGMACGDVTIHDFLAVRNLLPSYRAPTHVYIAVPTAEMASQAQTFAAGLREQGVNVAIDFGEKKLGDQIKAAAKHKIPYVIVLGPDELASGQVVVRDLTSGHEKTLSREQLSEFFLNLV